MNINREAFKKELNHYISDASFFTDQDRMNIKERLHEKPRKSYKTPLAIASSVVLIAIILLSSGYFFKPIEQQYTASHFIEIREKLLEDLEKRRTFDEVVGWLGEEYTFVKNSNDSIKDIYIIRYDFVLNPNFINEEEYDFFDTPAVESGDLAGQVGISFSIEDDRIYSFSVMYVNEDRKVELFSTNRTGKIDHFIDGLNQDDGSRE